MNQTKIIKSTFIHAASPTELTAQTGYLAVKNGVIEGFSTEYGGRAPVEDYTGKLVIPGLCDLHTHAPQYAMRGLGTDMELLPWLNAYTFPEEGKFADPGYARAVYARFAADLLAKGTVRACVFATIHTETTLLLMDILEETGVTAYVGKVNMDRNAPGFLCEKTEDSLAETERWIKECEGRYTRVKPILTPRFVPAASPALLRGVGELAQKYGLPVQSHLSENKNECAWVGELEPDCGCYGAAYAKYGLLGGAVKTVMAHCVYCPPGEVELLAKNGVFAAHCPDSNANLASGMADARGLRNAGVRVALGSDLAGGHSVSILDAMAKAVRVSKQRQAEGGGKCLSVAEAFYMGTAAGARFFGERGDFSPGQPLRAVVLDDTRLLNTKTLSPAERLERMVYLYEDRKIEKVMI